MADLLPCPFCGRPAHLVIEDEFCRIRCHQCGATGSPSDPIREEDTIAAWNRRAPVAGWQPIETAPKDGTHVLVAFDNPPYSEHWTFQQRPPTVAHWFGPAPLPGLRAGGWYLSVSHNDGGRIDPTHWMPLPAAPVDGGEDA